MISPQFRLDLNNELIIDNFAGGGGASTGIELALGRHVDIAINHDAAAIAMHAANHPQTTHLCESVWDVDPREVTQGRPVGLVWLSPDCKHFSKAKGGKPVEKKIRGLAWVGVRWAATVEPRVIVLENVEEFITWGPLDKDGKPCKKNKGREFNAFVNALRRLGYVVEWKELRASDYGAPTIRKRLFLVARRDGEPIVWPEPTHAEPKLAKIRKLKPWRTAAECIDWTIPCPSIFERKKPLAEATLRRIAKGIMRYVVNAADPFIVPLTHQGADRVHSIGEPFKTITGAHRGELALAAPFLGVHYGANKEGGERVAPLDEPLRTQPTENRFALVSALLAQFNTTGNGKPNIGHAVTEPVSTVLASGTQQGLVASTLVKLRNNQTAQDPREPMPTLTAGGGHVADVRAFLIKYYGTDQDPKLRDPLHTVTTKDRYGLVTVKGETYQIVDIGLRMLQPRELFRAQGFPDSYLIGDDPEEGVTLTKSDQVRMVGNSVCPPLAAALVQANLVEMRIRVAA